MKNQGIIKNIHHHIGRSDGGLKEHIQCRSKGDGNTLLNVGVREDELKCLIVVIDGIWNVCTTIQNLLKVAPMTLR